MRKRWKGAIVAMIGAMAVTALIRSRRRRAAPADGASLAPSHRGPVSHRSTMARNAKLASLGAKTGGNFALHRARRVFADAERREQLDVEFEMKTASDVAAALGQMKGALMKLGQMISYLDHGLPEHVRAALADLQQDAPPMSGELAAGVVRDELGDDPTVIFAEWDPVPIASASIGQVHRAMTHDGRAVAVKVQYPGVDEAVASDLDNLTLIVAGMGQLFPGLDTKPFVEELRVRLIEELDYTLEARNQQLFHDYYAGHPFIHVPAVLDDYSTRRVLTSELADGVSWRTLLTWSQDEKNLAAETLYRFAFGSLYRLGAFNGDPHPGNYLFHPGGRVTFLDFGLVKHFTVDELKQFEDMIHWMVIEPNPAEFRATAERIGLFKAGEPFTDDEVVDYNRHFYEFILYDDDYTITADYASETVRRFFDQRGPYGEIMKAANLPPSFVIINRINLGLYALFGELDACRKWRGLANEVWPWVNGPPTTPMGETIADWASARAS